MDAGAASRAKRELRQRAREAVQALPPAQRAFEEEVVVAAVQDAPAWRTARTVLLYRSVAPELSTVGLALAAWREGKRVAFPRVLPDGPGAGGAMSLHLVTGWVDFEAGYRGIPEPRPACPVVEPAVIDLAIVPASAWDESGRRLGRGGGHFDRLVPHLRCPVWGLAFDAQVMPEVPAEPHDAKAGKVWHARAITRGTG